MVLAGNLIDEDGAEALGKALCYNTTLTEISLQGNAIGKATSNLTTELTKYINKQR